MLAVIRSHHERYDGKGYPDKINGSSINIFSQIISVADAYDAMTSPRAYRPVMSQQKAIEELRRNAGTQFNAQVVEVFIKLLQSGAV
jgi:HD-GYP domain-containing protein (c-di-GMP phosphodiesterase class II)